MSSEESTPEDRQTERLRELVDKWREYARMGAEPGKTETFIARAQTYGKCADELEEAIENGEVTA